MDKIQRLCALLLVSGLETSELLGYWSGEIDQDGEAVTRDNTVGISRSRGKRCPLSSCYGHPMYNLGVLLEEQGQVEEAETWYRRAADLGFEPPG